MDKTKRHLIITGTGRSGTTFLVQLFTVLGLDTGFKDASSGVYDNCNAGMETDIESKDAPYVVKSPFLCDTLDGILKNGKIKIDFAIVPIRDLFSAAESRRNVSSKTSAEQFPLGIPGGVWDAKNEKNQELILQKKFYNIMHTLVENDIPTILLHFPKFIHEPKYAYEKLFVCLKEKLEYNSFLSSFLKVARPNLIHNFNK